MIYDADVGVELAFTLTTPEGAAFVLTGYTVELLVEGRSSALVMEVTDAAAGKARYVVTAGALAAGLHRAQVRVTKGTQKLHSEPVTLNVGGAVTLA